MMKVWRSGSGIGWLSSAAPSTRRSADGLGYKAEVFRLVSHLVANSADDLEMPRIYGVDSQVRILYCTDH